MREPLDRLQASSTPVQARCCLSCRTDGPTGCTVGCSAVGAGRRTTTRRRAGEYAGCTFPSRHPNPDVPGGRSHWRWSLRPRCCCWVSWCASPGNEVDPGLSPSVLDVPPSRPPITPASTTATATTVAVVTASDEEIAAAVLLDAEEYGEGWIQTAFKDVVLDRSLAAEVPACAPYLDTVFEGPARPADSALRHFYLGSVPAATRQYVLVFPTDAAAGDFFNATATPTFRGDCLEPYRALTVEVREQLLLQLPGTGHSAAVGFADRKRDRARRRPERNPALRRRVLDRRGRRAARP